MRGAALAVLCLAELCAAADAPLHAEILRLQDLGRPTEALRAAEAALATADSDAALALQMAELILATRGSDGLEARLTRLDAQSPQRPLLIAVRHLAAQRNAPADSILAAWSADVGRGDLERLWLARQRLLLHLRGPGGLQLGQVDSLLAWMRERIPQEPTLDGHFAILCELGDRRQELMRGEREQLSAKVSALAERAEQRGLRTAELETRIFVALQLARAPQDRSAAWGEVERVARALDDARMAAIAKNFRGFAFADAGNSAAAIRDWNSALPVFEAMGETNGAAWNRLSYGWHQLQRGEIEAAETALLAARDGFAELGQHQGLGFALIDLGVLYAYTEQVVEAFDFYQQALRIAEADGNLASQSDLLNNLGSLRQMSGDFEGALTLYEQSLELAKRIGDDRRTSSRLSNMALSSMSLGHVEQANLLYGEAVDIARLAGEPAVATIVNWAAGLTTLGELDRARNKLESIADEIDGAPVGTRADYLLNLGRLEYREAHWQRAIASLDSANSLFRGLRSPTKQIPGLVLAAIAYERLGQPERALEQAARIQALPISGRRLYPQMLAANSRTPALLALGRLEEAQQSARSALELYGEMRRSFELDQFSQAEARDELLTRPGTLAYHNFILATDAFDEADPVLLEEAFDRLQQIKSSSLLERLGRARLRLRPSAEPGLSRELRHAKGRLNHLLARYEREAADSLRTQLARAEADLHAARARLLGADPNYRRANATEVASLRALRERLDPQTLVLDFFVPIEGEALLFLVSERSIRLISLGEAETLRANAELLVQLVEKSPRDDERAARTIVLENLSRRLLADAGRELRAAGRLVICPDGILHRIAFSMLRFDGKALAQSHTISVLPSLGLGLAIAERNDDPPRERDIAIWLGGSTLRHAPREAAALRRRFANCELFRGDAGDGSVHEVETSGMLEPARILHFISHGEYDEKRPWNSGLILSAGDDEGSASRMDATDLYALDLSADLVCLAACESARGSGTSGLGVQSFAHAWLGAGARSILASLWRVDDAFTALFTARFYEELAAGADKATALARAQRHFLSQENWSEPYYWAAFELLGDGRGRVPIRTRARSTRALLFFAAAIALLLTGLVLRQRRSASLSPSGMPWGKRAHR